MSEALPPSVLNSRRFLTNLYRLKVDIGL